MGRFFLDPKTKEIYTPNTDKTTSFGGGNAPKELLDNSADGGIIEERKKSNWVKGEHGYFKGSVSNGAGGYTRMSKSEYYRLCSEIFTDFPLLKADGKRYNYENRNHFYEFSVNETGSYTFHLKIKISGNEDLLPKGGRPKND